MTSTECLGFRGGARGEGIRPASGGVMYQVISRYNQTLIYLSKVDISFAWMR